MSRDYQYFDRKVRDLQLENSVLREQLTNSSRNYGNVPASVLLDLHSRNERLERQAYKYESSIKSDLSTYLTQSMVQGQCYFKDRYTKMLRQPKNNYKVYY